MAVQEYIIYDSRRGKEELKERGERDTDREMVGVRTHESREEMVFGEGSGG